MNKKFWLNISLFVIVHFILISVTFSQNNIDKSLSGKIFCIDPGHGKFKKSHQEKIAPTSNTTKPAFVSGAKGIKYTEAEINLQISKKLGAKLILFGAQVVITRSDENALLSNIERAKLANKYNADLAIRLHADGSNNKAVRGMSMLIPGDKYIKNSSLITKSRKFGEAILKHTIKTTGAKNRGIVKRNDMTGFNWSEVPVVLFEMGFMSNIEDENLLASDEYQEKIIDGIVDGILEYYKTES